MFFPTLDKTFIIVTSILWNEKIKNQNFWDTFSKYKRYSECVLEHNCTIVED